MSILILSGPCGPQETITNSDGLLLEFTPFHKKSVNETDARKIKAQYPQATYRLGIFDAAPLNQLLYLMSEDLINGALISRIGEADLRRICETSHRPIFLEGTCKSTETIQREQRLPIQGHFFLALPDKETLAILNKPYILSMNAIEKNIENAKALAIHPPFALWCEPAATEETRRWADTILTK
ncbi:MAG: hypothetical protein IKV45_00885 [Firmicutes bacterium]|nr:hypothetical protein [Bacillota bacterium]